MTPEIRFHPVRPLMTAAFPAVCLLAVLAAGRAGTAAEDPPKGDGKASSAKDVKKEAKSAKSAKSTKTAKPKTSGKKPAAKARPRLVISSAGLRLEEPGRAPRRFASLAEIAREAPGTEGIFVIEGRDTADRQTIRPAAEGKGSRIRIAAGEIPALELARFLSDYTGLPVLHEGGASLASRTVMVPSAIESADGDIVRSLLRANGILVSEEVLGKDQRAIFLDSMEPRAGAEEPGAKPIVVVSPGEEQASRASRRGRESFRMARGPEPRGEGYFGLTLSPVPEMVEAQIQVPQGRGVMVSGVDPESKGHPELRPLMLYDVITHVNEDAVSSAEDFARILDAIPGGVPIHFRTLRKGITRILPAEKAPPGGGGRERGPRGGR